MNGKAFLYFVFLQKVPIFAQDERYHAILTPASRLPAGIAARSIDADIRDSKNNQKQIIMDATILTPAQQHLLKLFSFDRSDSYAREIQEVLMRHFQKKLDEESDFLWDAGVLNQERLDDIKNEDLHAKD